MNKNVLIGTLSVWLFSCSQSGEKSDAYGNFEANPVIVSSESAGKILQLLVEQGQSIETGSLAALIDTTQTDLKRKQIDAQKTVIEAQRHSIHSQIAVFEEQIKNLRTNEQRIARMVKDGAATQNQLDDVTGQIRVIERQIESTSTQFSSINGELKVLELQKLTTEDLLSRCRVRSPASGMVLETYIEEGELVTPGKPLFKMANLDELTLRVYVSGSQLPHITIGQQVDVLIDKPAKDASPLKGTVTWISPEAEFTPRIIQTREERVKLVYAVKVAVENDGTLKIGMPGEIRWQ